MESPPNLFDRLGGVRAIAERYGFAPATVQDWKNRRGISRKRQREFLQTAERLGDDVSVEDVMFPFPEDRTAS